MPASQAFDGDTGTQWDGYDYGAGAYPVINLYYDAGAPVQVGAYGLRDSGCECPTAWTLRASEVGSSWVTLDERNLTKTRDGTCASAWRNFTIDATEETQGRFRYFAFYFTQAFPDRTQETGDGIRLNEAGVWGISTR
jgi:hypothetical protein